MARGARFERAPSPSPHSSMDPRSDTQIAPCLRELAPKVIQMHHFPDLQIAPCLRELGPKGIQIHHFPDPQIAPCLRELAPKVIQIHHFPDPQIAPCLRELGPKVFQIHHFPDPQIAPCLRELPPNVTQIHHFPRAGWQAAGGARAWARGGEGGGRGCPFYRGSQTCHKKEAALRHAAFSCP